MSGEDSTAQPIRVVLITGAPGSGKTTAAERLARLYRVPAAVVDADWLAGIWPWREDEGLYRLIADNLAAVMAGHRRHGARVLVVSGVFLPGRVLAAMRDLLADPAYTWVAYGLRANASTIGDRIAGYRGVQDPALRASMSALDAEVGGVPGVREIRTDGLAAEDVLAAICAAERADGLEVGDIGSPQPAAEPVPLGLRDAAALGEKALIGRGVPAETAAECVRRLIAAEAEGASSHGLVRLIEYCDALDGGELDPAASPSIAECGSGWSVHGRGALGVLTAGAVQECLLRALDAPAPVLVSVRQGGHLGRLRDLVAPVAERGLVVLGFANYGGTGQKVAPAGSGRPRFGTNPLVFGFPARDGRPVVVDLGTSSWSEGAVRVAAARGAGVPEGVLVDAEGRAVTDPARLYTDSDRTALTTLGTGSAGTGHKGYALAMMVELLAGSLAGGGVCREAATTGRGGNGALFIAIRPEHLGRTAGELAADVDGLERHLRRAEPLRPDRPVRLPGRGRTASAPGVLRIHPELLERLESLGGAR